MSFIGNILEVQNLNLTYPIADGNLDVLKDINFILNEGEILSVIGKNGCGKSSLLRVISNLERNYKGNIKLRSNDTFKNNVNLGFIFQEANLFDWLTVFENIAYGLRVRKIEENEINNIVNEFIKAIGLDKYKYFYPKELSGGMQQRVSLARTLILKPKIILMDEPFSALDYQTRIEMQELTIQLWSSYKPSIILVTHDIDEAIFLSDRVIIMDGFPGTINEIIDVNFSRPRPLDILTDQKFNQIKKRLLKVFVNEL